MGGWRLRPFSSMPFSGRGKAHSAEGAAAESSSGWGRPAAALKRFRDGHDDAAPAGPFLDKPPLIVFPPDRSELDLAERMLATRLC